MRPDVEKSKAAIQQAIANGATGDNAATVQKPVSGCTYYMVTFASTVVIASDAPGEGSRRISGRGTITFGLAPDMSEPDFELTSGPVELTAPVWWSGAEVTPGNGCVVTITPLPFTPAAFWLGVSRGADQKVTVQVTPSGDEQHPTTKKCPNGMGGWSPAMPGRESIFFPAWIALHGDGKSAAAQPGVGKESRTDPSKMMKEAMAQPKTSPLMSMDPRQLQAMADKLKGKEPSPAEMAELVKSVVPNADQLVEEARNNFTLRMPGDCTTSGALVRCSVRRTVRLPDGKGTTQSITESTEITIGSVSVGTRRP